MRSTLMGAVALLAFEAGAWAQRVDIGTMSQGTISYATGAAIAQVLQQQGGYNASVQPNSGETTVMPLVNSGELDFGISSVGEVARAVDGNGIFEGRAQQDLLAVAALFPLKVGLFVRADSEIRTIADLRGKRVTAEFTAMGVIDLILRAVLANGGLTADDIEPVAVPNVARGADDFIAGRTDAFFFGLGAAKVLEADASVGGLRMLALDSGPDAVARMTAVFPQGFLVEQNPKPNMPGFAEPVPVMSYDNILLVNRSVPDDIVAGIARALVENKEALAMTFPPFGDLVIEDLYKPLPLDYHPAAKAYYEGAGL